ncbi:amidohydrolase family protein [Brevibacterium luteolum]|uniref:Amidohydrolase family protein n=1 Tax=Brevibacterium luteolum TaxID=199591 RepID=A0A849AV31_9MICO|nr:amidohydrolase family protein [Brevibacterium luteolum]MBM7529765.1 cytosine/adenosine deaminase-related metal-dependent hydrolase [Brevibacterium luteolum]NNG78524.1 amidohydrolase family protein [Brevibacterium luteolum]
MPTILTGARLFNRAPDADPVDITLDDGTIAAIAPAAEAAPASTADVIDATGYVVMPSLGDVHAHLDSNRLGQTFRPHTAGSSLHELIMNDRANWRHGERSAYDQAVYAASRMVASGATRIRTHAQIDSDCQLERFEALHAAKETLAGIVDMEIVAFPQAGLLRDADAPRYVEQGLAAGADLIGGLDPTTYDRDPKTHLDMVFGWAEKYGLGIDIHLHERGTVGVFSLEEIIARTQAAGMQGKVTVSHCFVLGSVAEREQRRLAEMLAANQIAVTTVAPAGTVLPLGMLAETGVRVGLGEDGQRDYWSPYGDGDVLRRVWQLAFTNGFRADADIEHCLDVASRGGRHILDGVPHAPAGDVTSDAEAGLAVGAPADLLLAKADTVTAAIMDCPDERFVFKAGRLIARNGKLTG